METAHLSWNPPQAGQHTLVTGVGEHLHAHADAQHGNTLAKHHVIERLPHSRRTQALHGMVEGAHARQDQLAGTGQLISAGRYRDRYMQALVDVYEGLNVTQTIIDDGDHLKSLLSNPRALITREP